MIVIDDNGTINSCVYCVTYKLACDCEILCVFVMEKYSFNLTVDKSLKLPLKENSVWLMNYRKNYADAAKYITEKFPAVKKIKVYPYLMVHSCKNTK